MANQTEDQENEENQIEHQGNKEDNQTEHQNSKEENLIGRRKGLSSQYETRPRVYLGKHPDQPKYDVYYYIIKNRDDGSLHRRYASTFSGDPRGEVPLDSWPYFTDDLIWRMRKRLVHRIYNLLLPEIASYRSRLSKKEENAITRKLEEYFVGQSILPSKGWRIIPREEWKEDHGEDPKDEKKAGRRGRRSTDKSKTAGLFDA